MSNSSILVTGGNGQLGSELKELANNYPHFTFTFIDVADLDLTDEIALKKYFAENKFGYIVNCAAYTAVDAAEENKDLAHRVNAHAVKMIAQVANENDIRVIHISTDYVFSGEQNQPIGEDEQTGPISVYGETKLAGEKTLMATVKNAYIIRTAWVYSTFGKNFVKSILNAAKQRPELGVVADQIGSPTYARDLASAILSIIDSIHSGKKDAPGIYHYTNEGVISWYDFAHFIVAEKKLNSKVKPIRTSEYKTLAARPKFSVLSKDKIKSTFGISIPHWHDSLRKVLAELK